MATLATYDFTGTNGTVPAGFTAAGGTVSIQSNKLSILSPATAYSVATVIVSGLTATSDNEMLLSFSLNATKVEQYPVFALRCTSATVWTTGGSQGQPTTGYSVLMNSTANTWSVVNNATGVNLSGALAFTFTGGTTYQLRFRCVGTQIAARLWDPAGAEPGTWGYNDVTATTTTAGQAMFVSGSGAAATAMPLTIDDLTITDGTTAVGGGGTGSSYTSGTATALSTARTATNTVADHTADHVIIAAALNDLTTRGDMIYRLAANTTTTSTTVVDITGLLPVAVVAGATYAVDFYGAYQTSVVTTQPLLAIGGTATLTSALARVETMTTVNTTTVRWLTAVNTLSTAAGVSSTAVATSYALTVHGTVVVNAAGTFGVRWGVSAASTQTMVAGSYLILNRIA